jgi:hypothetical protein
MPVRVADPLIDIEFACSNRLLIVLEICYSVFSPLAGMAAYLFSQMENHPAKGD